MSDDTMTCGHCGGACMVVPTAYGERANCAPCGVRWTRLRRTGVLHLLRGPMGGDRRIVWFEEWREERL